MAFVENLSTTHTCTHTHTHTHRSSFSEFASKYGRDERFKSIEKMKEREQLFTEHLAELRKRSKQKEGGGQKQAARTKAEKVS